jgi:two-component system chemotaxis sensor kinase CheA
MSDNENKNAPPIIELDFDFNEEIQVVSEVFFKEAQEILEDLDDHIVKLEARPHDEVLLQSLFRKMHTLKGSAGAVPGGQLFGSLSHEFETLLDRLRKQNLPPDKACIEMFLHSSRLLKILAENLRLAREIYPEELSEVIELISRYGSFQLSSESEADPKSSRMTADDGSEGEAKNPKDGVWLSKEQMESLMQLSSEFILLKNSFQSQAVEEKHSALSHSLHTLSDQFQGILDKAQKLPLKEALAGLFPLVRQAAYELKKEVHFVDQGFEIEIDKSLAQDLSKALMHMVRNSMDHGIEKPEERLAAGKPAPGSLRIEISEQSSILHCRIIDDGKGLDKARILQRALEKGLTNALEAAHLSEEKIFGFIFHPGFSTKERITTMSGRGVGMDVVQNIVTKYGGRIAVSSEAGKGTKLHLSIPIPRKVLVERCLLGDWRDFALAFPLSDVSRISSCQELQITEVDGLRFCQHEGQTVPLLALKEIYEFKTFLPASEVKAMSVVFLKMRDLNLGFLVDHIHHQTDLVIKSFGPLIKKTPGFKGNSILSDDQIAYVVDPDELRQLIRKEAV